LLDVQRINCSTLQTTLNLMGHELRAIVAPPRASFAVVMPSFRPRTTAMTATSARLPGIVVPPLAPRGTGGDPLSEI
ncbi:MAG: hypothetical protein QF565_10395, partial [Arenicellales bacterium]|nr:hypothetical protein [Arenicellales bacterium]